jgi:PAS domain S-box-containing protein
MCTVSDVTERRRVEEERQRLLWLLDDIGKRMSLLLFVKSCEDLTFELWNHRFEELTGFRQAELTGRTGKGFFSDEELAGYQERDRRVIADRVPVSVDEPITTRHGVKRIHTKKILVGEGEARPRYLLGISEEINEQGRIVSERGRLYEDVVSTLHRQGRLLSTVSHDLNNSLGVITMSASSLLAHRDEGWEEVREKHARRIAGMAQQMVSLISDLRSHALLQEGRLVLDRCPVPAEVLVTDAVEQHQGLAESRDIELRVEAGPGLPLVSCDRRQISRVFANLVGNAIKFAPRGIPITVRASAAADHVRYSVSDSGPGIAREDLPRVFEPYWQADAARRQGTGLGLAIAKEIVEAHGGAIGVESEPGRGSTFFFTVPSCPVAPET